MKAIKNKRKLLNKCYKKLLDDFYKKQTEEIKEQFKTLSKHAVVATYSELEKYTKQHEGLLISEHKEHRIYVIKFQDDEYQFWVDASYAGYKKGFERFLIKYHNFPEQFTIPKHKYHVDHLFNKSRVLSKPSTEIKYVRCILLPYGINTSYGRSYERLSTKNEKNFRSNNRINLDFVTFLKALGLKAPTKGTCEKWEEDATDYLLKLEIVNDRTYAKKNFINPLMKLAYEGNFNNK
jgi:hypothetical protein